MVYTQAPSLTNAQIESLLKEAKVARFCSFNADGTIHATPIWFMYENKRIIMQTPAEGRKARNVKRNGRVTVLVEGEGDWPSGVIVYGKAGIRDWTEDMSREALNLFEKYMPRDKAELYSKGVFKLTKLVMISVEPQRMASFDYAKDEAFKQNYLNK